MILSVDESVRPESEEETKNYELLSKITHKASAILESRWREPSLTIHTVEVSGPKSRRRFPICSFRYLTHRWFLQTPPLSQEP